MRAYPKAKIAVAPLLAILLCAAADPSSPEVVLARMSQAQSNLTTLKARLQQVKSYPQLGIEDPQALVGSRVKAFLVSARNQLQEPLPSAAELESFVRPKLEPYKIPVAFEWINEIPRNDLGKPRRHVLREQEARPRDA